MARPKSTATAYGALGALMREGPARIWNEDGEWRPEAVKTLIGIANQLLGLAPGVSTAKTLRSQTPEQQILTEDFADFAVWDADTMTRYARKRRPGARRFQVAKTDTKYRRKRGKST